jgi:hypothetical protein
MNMSEENKARVYSILNKVIAAGWTIVYVDVDDGDGDDELTPAETLDEAFEIIDSVDHPIVHFDCITGSGMGWLELIISNDEDMLTDCSSAFENIVFEEVE